MRSIFALRVRYAVPINGAILFAAATAGPVEVAILHPGAVHGSWGKGIHVLVTVALIVCWFVPFNAGWQRWQRRRPSLVLLPQRPKGGLQGPQIVTRTVPYGTQPLHLLIDSEPQRHDVPDRAVIAGVILRPLYQITDTAGALIVDRGRARVLLAGLAFLAGTVWFAWSGFG